MARGALAASWEDGRTLKGWHALGHGHSQHKDCGYFMCSCDARPDQLGPGFPLLDVRRINDNQ